MDYIHIKCYLISQTFRKNANQNEMQYTSQHTTRLSKIFKTSHIKRWLKSKRNENTLKLLVGIKMATTISQNGLKLKVFTPYGSAILFLGIYG